MNNNERHLINRQLLMLFVITCHIPRFTARRFVRLYTKEL